MKGHSIYKRFNILALSSILVLMLTTLGYFFYYNLYNLEYISTNYQNYNSLNSIKVDSAFKKYNELLEFNKLKKVSNDFNSFTKILTQLELSKHYSKRLYDLNDLSNKISIKLKKVQTQNNIAIYTSSFQKKIKSFNSFVNKNNWRTLTRISKRIMTRSVNLNSSRNTFVKRVISEINQDLTIMKNVTKTSVLPKKDKTNVTNFIGSLSKELKIISDSIKSIDQIKNDISTLGFLFTSFSKDLSSKLIVDRIDWNKRMFTVFSLLLSVILLTFLFLVLSPFINRYLDRKFKLSLENYSINLIKDQLIVENPKDLINANKKFETEMLKFHKYFHYRMNYGLLFQDTLPFSSILLNTNLKAVWSNNLFLETFSLSRKDLDSGAISWDYISRFTNLKDTSHIQDAVQSLNPNILQLRVINGEKQIPYELYLCPIKLSNKTYVMLYMYPLSSLEDTILNQAKCIMNPISNILTLMKEDRLSEKELHEIKKDFDEAKIENIFNLIEDIKIQNDEKDNNLNSEINDLNGKIVKLNSIMSEVYSSNKDLLTNYEVLLQQFNNLKYNFINYVEVNHNLIDVGNDNLNSLKSKIEPHNKLKEISDKFRNSLKEFNTIFKSMLNYKEQIKNDKSSISQDHQKLIQSITKTIVYCKNNKIENSIIKIFENVLSEVYKIDKSFQHFEKTFSSMEILLSKINLLTSGGTEISDLVDIDLNDSKFAIKIESLLKDFETNLKYLEKECTFIEDNLVNKITQMDKGIKNNQEQTEHIENLAQDGISV